MLENHIHKYYFDKFNVTRFNSYNPKMYYIGIGSERDYKLTPSSQFSNNSCPRKSSSLSNFIKKKCNRMKMLLNINVILRDEGIDIPTTKNNRVSSRQSSICKIDDDDNTFRFVKDFISRSGFGNDSSIEVLIKSIKEMQINDCNKRLLNLINMNVEGSSNVSYERLPVEETELKKIILCYIIFIFL